MAPPRIPPHSDTSTSARRSSLANFLEPLKNLWFSPSPNEAVRPSLDETFEELYNLLEEEGGPFDKVFQNVHTPPTDPEPEFKQTNKSPLEKEIDWLVDELLQNEIDQIIMDSMAIQRKKQQESARFFRAATPTSQGPKIHGLNNTGRRHSL